jgi:hypothetical protein
VKKTIVFILLLGFIACSITYCNNASAEQYSIPGWIKNPVKWWHDGKIGDSDFVQGMDYLLNQGVIKIPQSPPTLHFSPQIPTWVKTITGDWADGQMSNEDFVKAIQYLVTQACPNGQELQYLSSNSTWTCSTDKAAQNANYVISKSSSIYYAKNGITNTIDFSGTNATTVVQNAINNLGSSGGKIVFEAGEFPVSIMVTKSNLTFEGQGESTILIRDGDKNIFNISGKFLPDKSVSIHYIIIKNMELLGDPRTYQTDCIYAKNTALMTFDSIRIEGCHGNGIYFEVVYDSRILNSNFGYDGNQALGKAALYLYGGSNSGTNNIYVTNCGFETQQGDDVISRGVSLDLGNYMINFLSDKFESYENQNLVKHHINFTNTKGSIIEASYITDASDSNVYLGQTTDGIKLIGNFFTNDAYPPINPPTYDIDIQGRKTIVIGNNFERVTLAHINIGPSATSTQILGNSYDLTNGEKTISGNVENVVK